MAVNGTGGSAQGQRTVAPVGLQRSSELDEILNDLLRDTPAEEAAVRERTLAKSWGTREKEFSAPQGCVSSQSGGSQTVLTWQTSQEGPRKCVTVSKETIKRPTPGTGRQDAFPVRFTDERNLLDAVDGRRFQGPPSYQQSRTLQTHRETKIEDRVLSPVFRRPVYADRSRVPPEPPSRRRVFSPEIMSDGTILSRGGDFSSPSQTFSLPQKRSVTSHRNYASDSEEALTWLEEQRRKLEQKRAGRTVNYRHVGDRSKSSTDFTRSGGGTYPSRPVLPPSDTDDFVSPKSRLPLKNSLSVDSLNRSPGKTRNYSRTLEPPRFTKDYGGDYSRFKLVENRDVPDNRARDDRFYRVSSIQRPSSATPHTKYSFTMPGISSYDEYGRRAPTAGLSAPTSPVIPARGFSSRDAVVRSKGRASEWLGVTENATYDRLDAADEQLRKGSGVHLTAPLKPVPTETEHISLRPIGPGVQDLEPGGTIEGGTLNFRRSTPTLNQGDYTLKSQDLRSQSSLGRSTQQMFSSPASQRRDLSYSTMPTSTGRSSSALGDSSVFAPLQRPFTSLGPAPPSDALGSYQSQRRIYSSETVTGSGQTGYDVQQPGQVWSSGGQQASNQQLVNQQWLPIQPLSQQQQQFTQQEIHYRQQVQQQQLQRQQEQQQLLLQEQQRQLQQKQEEQRQLQLQEQQRQLQLQEQQRQLQLQEQQRLLHIQEQQRQEEQRQLQLQEQQRQLQLQEQQRQLQQKQEEQRQLQLQEQQRQLQLQEQQRQEEQRLLQLQEQQRQLQIQEQQRLLQQQQEQQRQLQLQEQQRQLQQKQEEQRQLQLQEQQRQEEQRQLQILEQQKQLQILEQQRLVQQQQEQQRQLQQQQEEQRQLQLQEQQRQLQQQQEQQRQLQLQEQQKQLQIQQQQRQQQQQYHSQTIQRMYVVEQKTESRQPVASQTLDNRVRETSFSSAIPVSQFASQETFRETSIVDPHRSTLSDAAFQVDSASKWNESGSGSQSNQYTSVQRSVQGGSGAQAVEVQGVGSNQVGGQVGVSQVGASQVGVSQVGASQVGANQFGVSQVGASQVGASQVGASQVGASQVGVSSQVGASHVAGPVGVNQSGGQMIERRYVVEREVVGKHQGGGDHVNVNQTGGQVGRNQFGTQVGVQQTGGQVGLNQVGTQVIEQRYVVERQVIGKGQGGQQVGTNLSVGQADVSQTGGQMTHAIGTGQGAFQTAYQGGTQTGTQQASHQQDNTYQTGSVEKNIWVQSAAGTQFGTQEAQQGGTAFRQQPGVRFGVSDIGTGGESKVLSTPRGSERVEVMSMDRGGQQQQQHQQQQQQSYSYGFQQVGGESGGAEWTQSSGGMNDGRSTASASYQGMGSINPGGSWTLRPEVRSGGHQRNASGSFVDRHVSSPRFGGLGRARTASATCITDGAEWSHQPPRFVRDTSKYWHKPNITRDDAINLLLDKEPGSFVVRNSATFPGSFGLALKVSQVPPNMQTKGGDPQVDLIRHFLIEPTPKGVRLKGCSTEPVFASLAALIYQHAMTPLSLPCKLRLPEEDIDALDGSATLAGSESNPQLNGAACTVLYMSSVETENLTGPEALARSIKDLFESGRPLPRSTIVQFKVTRDGITLTDNRRRIFFRRFYPIQTITFCGVDPRDRRWTVRSEDVTISGKAFGFVARKPGVARENACHVFLELDPTQPASIIVNFVTKVLIGQGQRLLQ